MSQSYKPANYSTVSPYLILRDAAGTIEFLKRILGAEELRHFADEDGGIIHAEVRIDDTVIMMADGNENFPPAPSHVHVYVKDVEAVYQKALDAGAELVQEPMQQSEEEDRRAGLKDAGGTTWWIATEVS